MSETVKENGDQHASKGKHKKPPVSWLQPVYAKGLWGMSLQFFYHSILDNRVIVIYNNNS